MILIHIYIANNQMAVFGICPHGVFLCNKNVPNILLIVSKHIIVNGSECTMW